MIPVGPWFLAAILQWTQDAWLQVGVPISLPAWDLELFSNTSLIGWDAHVAEHTASGRWPVETQGLHINMLEMMAVSLAVQSFAQFLQDRSVLLCTDNTTVSCYVNKGGGSHSVSLSREAESLLLLCQDMHITLRAKHVSGKVNILADFLSRPGMVLQTEWTLTHAVLRQVWLHWFKPVIDLFATQFSKRLQVYVSPVPDPKALDIDALSMSWDGLSAYAYPPLPILSRVISKARAYGPQLILIAPLWPAQPWFPDLLELCHLPPLKLSVGKGDLVQPRSGIPHPNPEKLCLHAWLLCGKACEHQALLDS